MKNLNTAVAAAILLSYGLVGCTPEQENFPVDNLILELNLEDSYFEAHALESIYFVLYDSETGELIGEALATEADIYTFKMPEGQIRPDHIDLIEARKHTVNHEGVENQLMEYQGLETSALTFSGGELLKLDQAIKREVTLKGISQADYDYYSYTLETGYSDALYASNAEDAQYNPTDETLTFFLPTVSNPELLHQEKWILKRFSGAEGERWHVVEFDAYQQGAVVIEDMEWRILVKTNQIYHSDIEGNNPFIFANGYMGDPGYGYALTLGITSQGYSYVFYDEPIQDFSTMIFYHQSKDGRTIRYSYNSGRVSEFESFPEVDVPDLVTVTGQEWNDLQVSNPTNLPAVIYGMAGVFEGDQITMGHTIYTHGNMESPLYRERTYPAELEAIMPQVNRKRTLTGVAAYHFPDINSFEEAFAWVNSEAFDPFKTERPFHYNYIAFPRNEGNKADGRGRIEQFFPDRALFRTR